MSEHSVQVKATVKLGNVKLRVRFQLPEGAAEPSPDDAFVACNRIDSIDQDLTNLQADWQQELRRQLHDSAAPSMSVGDMVAFEHFNADSVTFWCLWEVEWDGWKLISSAFTSESLTW